MSTDKIEIWDAIQKVDNDAIATMAVLDKGTLGDPLQLKANVGGYTRPQGLAEFLCEHVNDRVLIIIQPMGQKKLPGVDDDDEDRDTRDWVNEAATKVDKQESKRSKDIVKNVNAVEVETAKPKPEPKVETVPVVTEPVAEPQPESPVETQEIENSDLDYDPFAVSIEASTEPGPVEEAKPASGPLYDRISEGAYFRRANGSGNIMRVKSKIDKAGIGNLEYVDTVTGEVAVISEGAINQFYEECEGPEEEASEPTAEVETAIPDSGRAVSFYSDGKGSTYSVGQETEDGPWVVLCSGESGATIRVEAICPECAEKSDAENALDAYARQKGWTAVMVDVTPEAAAEAINDFQAIDEQEPETEEAAEEAQSDPTADLVVGARLRAWKPLVPGQESIVKITQGVHEKNGVKYIRTSKGLTSVQVVREKYEVLPPE